MKPNILMPYFSLKDSSSSFPQSTTEKKKDEKIVKTPLLKSYLKSPIDNQLLIVNVVGDRSYQLYNQYSNRFRPFHERAKVLVSQKCTKFPGSDASLQDIWSAFLNDTREDLRHILMYTKNLPGLSALSKSDFNDLLKDNVFTIYVLTSPYLFLNNELFYFMDNDIQLTRKWFEKIIGVEACDLMFALAERLNELKATDTELSLMIPNVFLNIGN
jgi:hypothetical protein